MNISGFSNVAAHFKRMQERRTIKKLLAYQKEVNEGFAKMTYARSFVDTQWPRSGSISPYLRQRGSENGLIAKSGGAYSRL
jgi:hypothetical protein